MAGRKGSLPATRLVWGGLIVVVASVAAMFVTAGELSMAPSPFLYGTLFFLTWFFLFLGSILLVMGLRRVFPP